MNSKFRSEVDRIRCEIAQAAMAGNYKPLVTLTANYKSEDAILYDRIFEYFWYRGYDPRYVLAGSVFEGDVVLMQVKVKEPECGCVFCGKTLF